MEDKDKTTRGSIILFTSIVLTLVLSISFAILAIFIPKIRTASNTLSSVVAAYAADSGLEWCLYSQRGNPSPPAKPTAIGNATVTITYNGAVATCATTEKPLNHVSTGSYLNVARSFQITE